MLLVLRSLIFNIIFFTVFALSMVAAAPILLTNRKCVFMFWHYFSKILGWITRVFGGIKLHIDGAENLVSGPAIYAIRHESAWETLTLVHMFEQPIFVMKKELFSIPIFGPMARKSGAISIDRAHGVQALTSALRQIKQRIAEGHVIVIFPEGTRMPTGEFSGIKRGIALFYRAANCPVIPVVHDSGKFWPPHGFIKRPGTIKMKIFPAIRPGLNQDEFLQKLNSTFRTGVEELIEE